jgi:arginyl-tRNA synthetase
MIQAKQELLQALGRALAQLAPDAAPAAAFESPKQAAHGDLAITAAMPLARSLKKNPREIAQAWSTTLQADPRCSAGSRRSRSPAPASSTCA